MHYVLCLCIPYSSVFFEHIDVDEAVRLKDKMNLRRYWEKTCAGKLNRCTECVLIPQGSSDVNWRMFLDTICQITSSYLSFVFLDIDFINEEHARTWGYLQ